MSHLEKPPSSRSLERKIVAAMADMVCFKQGPRGDPMGFRVKGRISQ